MHWSSALLFVLYIRSSLLLQIKIIKINDITEINIIIYRDKLKYIDILNSMKIFMLDENVLVLEKDVHCVISFDFDLQKFEMFLSDVVFSNL